MANARKSRRIATKVKQEMDVKLEDEEGLFYIQRIVDKRMGSEGLEYRVRWKGYRATEDTWEEATKLVGCLTYRSVGLVINILHSSRRGTTVSRSTRRACWRRARSETGRRPPPPPPLSPPPRSIWSRAR